jgi:peptidoglycan/xylan/chitin deacetylase (PgdA/CDA1 family)
MSENVKDEVQDSTHFFAYHEIHNAAVNDVYCITPEIFLHQLWTMRNAVAGLNRSVVVTFDDGHESNRHWAAPLLEAVKLRGHFFLPTTWIGQRKGFIDWNEARSLAEHGHCVGSHSATHAFLPRCSPLRMHEELAGSRRTLEDRLGRGVTSISMPGGRWNEEVIRACAMAGYQTVYTSEPGYFRPSSLAGELRMPTVIGRFAVQRRTGLTAIQGYARGKALTTVRLQLLYRARAGVKRLLGDETYQRLWSQFFRGVPRQEVL